LSVEQQEAVRLYVNVAPNESNQEDKNKSEQLPSTPLTPKQVEYSNLSVGLKVEMNTYANIALGEIGDKSVKQMLQGNEHSQKFSESDTFTSMSPIEDVEVNYAILDIDCSKDNTIRSTRDLISPESQSYNSSRNESTASCSSQPRGRLVSQNSVDKQLGTNASNATPLAAIGYTTIDFDKTVALTSVAAGNEMDLMDGTRRTRHNSGNLLLSGSPCVIEKSKPSSNN
jgi:hypothetical protein